MAKNSGSERVGHLPADQAAVPFGSNEVRLSPREWAIALIIIAVVFCFAPIVWERAERLEIEPDYRIPFSLGSDYWIYDRYCRAICAQDKTLVIGDSVIWGHYVAKEQTLSHHLSAIAREERFANMGVDGIHPAALAGLMEYYGRAISGKNVILHCNLLWMSSERHDLQTEKEFSFNHPRLVPQFFPRIPCYRELFAGRLAIVIERRLPLYGWTNHLRVAYFESMDIPTWTVERPYANPIGAITLELPSPDEPPSPEPVAESWRKRRIAKFNPPWVELEVSFQWASFKRTIEILKRRGNRVFVLLGPFNEHMLGTESLATYNKRKLEVEAWLQESKLPYYVPAALPTDSYADASHPMGEGYAMIARQLFEDEAFLRFDAHVRNSSNKGNPR